MLRRMDWQITSRASIREWIVALLAFGSVIFIILVVVGRLTHANYMKDGLGAIFVVSVLVFAQFPLALYVLARSTWKWWL